MHITRRTATKAILASTAGAPFLATTSALGAEADRAPEERLRTQVCVIGGGSGGIGASLAAARAGAEVVLLERDAILGGTTTTAWVHTWEPVRGADGIPRDLYEVMRADPTAITEPDYAKGAPRRGGRSLPFEPRALVYAARRLLSATGRCRVLLGATFCRARVEGDRLKAVEAWFSGKRLVVEADVFLDCTADGDLCAAAGCDYHLGEDPRSRYNEPTAPKDAGMHLNGLTLCYRITDTGVKQKPYLPEDIPEGICPRPVHVVAMPCGDHLLNAVDMLDGNALLEWEYSRLMHEAHRRVLEHFFWLQRLDPEREPRWTRHTNGAGYGTWAIAGIAPRIGVRESRRILGDYVLTEHDCRAGAAGQKHNDLVAICDHAVDIHGRKGRLYEVPNGPYGVPYRCLLPRGVRNLMIASRAASFSHVAASSCRLQRTMITLGQAAGNAAALCVKHGVPPREVDVRQLQAALVAQGVAIGAA
jgi:hypothetical protein